MMENKNGRDTTEVLLTRKQMNKKLTVMAFTGYLVNLIITLLFGREILTFTESSIDSLAFGYVNYFQVAVSPVVIVFAVLIILAAVMVWWTADKRIQMLAFFIAAVCQSFFLMLLIPRDEKVFGASAKPIYDALVILWSGGLVYILFLYLMSCICPKVITKLRYTLVINALFATILALVGRLDFNVTVMLWIAGFLFSMYMTGMWMRLNNRKENTCQEYRVLLTANCMVNLVAFVISGRGYYGAGNIFRR